VLEINTYPSLRSSYLGASIAESYWCIHPGRWARPRGEMRMVSTGKRASAGEAMAPGPEPRRASPTSEHAQPPPTGSSQKAQRSMHLLLPCTRDALAGVSVHGSRGRRRCTGIDLVLQEWAVQGQKTVTGDLIGGKQAQYPDAFGQPDQLAGHGARVMAVWGGVADQVTNTDQEPLSNLLAGAVGLG